MNKKQLIIAWASGIIISLTFLFFPRKFLVYNRGEPIIVPSDTPISELGKPLLQWGYIFPIVITVIIIGSLLIYTLRDKKK